MFDPLVCRIFVFIMLSGSSVPIGLTHPKIVLINSAQIAHAAENRFPFATQAAQLTRV
jgi:hypothetical protein